MNPAQASRRLTALLASALFATAILLAAPTLRLGVAETTGQSQALGAMIDDAVVGARARETLLEISPPRDARARVLELGAILSQRPLSSAHWLQLARAHYEAGGVSGQFFDALAMSQLAGPNEASTMAGRAVFGLPFWSLASAKMRQALLRDLVGGWPQVSETRRMLLRVMFEDAVSAVRTQVADGLSLYGVQGGEIASRLGLVEAASDGSGAK